MLRPHPAQWFEILVARDDAAVLLEALARTGTVELEARPEPGERGMSVTELEPSLDEFARAQRQYAPYWPQALRPSRRVAPPADTLSRCLREMREWAEHAEPIVRELQRIGRERAEYRLWHALLDRFQEQGLDLATLAASGPLFAMKLLAFPEAHVPEFPPQVLARTFELGGRPHVLVLGPGREVEETCREAAGYKAQVHEIPQWLRGSVRESMAHAANRLAALDYEAAELDARLERLHAEHDLQCALGDANLLQWFTRYAPSLETGELFAWVTGWVTGRKELAAAIERSGARALARFPPPPQRLSPPMLLVNPWWARPFEAFSRALGMPASDEADPTRLLALAVPLLFGYMFGDVGQGLVLIAAGVLLARRFELARLLVAGGISAVVFGFLFGSVFGIEHVLAPLWLAPLADPLTVIVVPLVGGAILLTVGLLISAMEAYWRGALRAWLLTDAGLLATYVGLLLLFVQPAAWPVAALGALWHVAGSTWLAPNVQALLSGLFTLVEKTVQILINTLSFARVGAFALAHAGLSAATVALAEASGSRLGAVLVLVAGNVLVIVLEAIVVTVQTTRLVLFEFFIRFLAGRGRVFRPLPPPPLSFRET